MVEGLRGDIRPSPGASQVEDRRVCADSLTPMCAAVRDRALLRILLIVTGLRAVLALAGWVTVRFLPAARPAGEWSRFAVDDGSRGWWLIAPWQHWDALWYQHLAADGYRPNSPDAAFYPLYPLLTRVCGDVLGIGVAGASLLVSTVATVVALWLLHRLVAGDLGERAADHAVVYAAVFPAAFFLLAGYAEALLLALSVAAVLAARRRLFVVAGVLAALAAVTRPVGVLLVVPLAVEVAAEARSRWRRHDRPVRPAHFAVLLPVVAWVGYVLYTERALGLSGPFAAEDAWGSHLAWPWAAVWDSVHTVAGDPVEIINLLAVLTLIVALPLMVVRRLPAAYVAYAAISAVPVCFHETAGRLQSAGRFLLVVFPIYALLATYDVRPWAQRVLVAGSAATMLVLFVHFARGSFVG